MTARNCWFGLILLLLALPALGADHSAGFDRSWVTPEVVEELTTLALPEHWSALLGALPAPIDAYSIGVLVWLEQQGGLDEQSVREWVAEQEVETETLVGMLGGLSLAWRMEDPYRPVCAAIWGKVGDDIDTYLGFAPQARMLMTIYLGTLEREDDVKTLLSTFSLTEYVGGRRVHYFVASQLYSERKSLRAAVWAWQRASEEEGPEECARIAWIIRNACAVLDDAEVVRREFLPWLEDNLGPLGAGATWGSALSSLLWAYGYVGEPEKAAERGRYWLQQAQERGVPEKELERVKRQLAEILGAAGDVDQAAEFLAPQFTSVRPEQVVAWQKVGEETSRTVLVSGNLTFRVTGASCELPAVEVTVGERKLDEQGRETHYVVTVTFGPRDEAGTYETQLVLETNDPEKPTITLPVSVRVSAE